MYKLVFSLVIVLNYKSIQKLNTYFRTFELFIETFDSL
jgi:hypothetical protein